MHLTQPKEIVLYPNPVLIQKCSIVTDFDKNNFDFLKSILKKTEHGAGLAAPQIGITERFFAIRIDPEKEPEIWVNPSIVQTGKPTLKIPEGCLSLPGISFTLNRYKNIKVEGFNEDGSFKERNLFGFESLVFQHELDHLNGKLFIDYVPKVIKRRLLREYRTFKRHLKKV